MIAIERKKRQKKQRKVTLENKKDGTKSVFRVTGGVDGTRTRDPRRDRPVF
jgi:hypothetical protein